MLTLDNPPDMDVFYEQPLIFQDTFASNSFLV